ncbi:Glycosyl transferase family 2 [Marinomonas gallaica]|uniref:Glycosyl transferase family 2 n=1 Tax=Marinomonas gallaica TaxID=1806667 RepID=A0A1C3JV05_9GAMM|nr:glycosyltransferase [Marinomonas gallaica]SBT18955.1 Glycosyl transferase family 2 [Marinomonas gallaica]SBT21910.1 Glycosyl transferase family 2 [Marinomonas gallaica]
MSSYQYSELKKQLKELLDSGHYDQADLLLKAGLMDANKTNEMLIWIAMFALKRSRPKQAQAALACLTIRDNTHQPLHLLTQALSNHPESALAVAREAYRTAPLEKSNLALYLKWLKQNAGEQHLQKIEQILSWYIPDFNNATDLIGKVEYLIDLGYQQIAIIRREQETFKGWVLRHQTDTPPPVLLIITNGSKVTRYVPKRRLPILSGHDLWQFEISFQGVDLNTTTVDIRFEDEETVNSKIYTHSVPQKNVNSVPRPTAAPQSNSVGAHSVPRPTAAPQPNSVGAHSVPRPAAAPQSNSVGAHSVPRPANAPQSSIIDVIIPVYAGLDTTLACINSALTSVPKNQTALNILVVNDATPDVDLANALTDLAYDQHIELLVNTENLGFIGAVNRALEQHKNRDVILLNSDTLVHSNWLDRILEVAYNSEANQQASVASVTPYTNNGELMSLLGPNIPAPALQSNQLAALDKAAHAANSEQHNWLTIDAPCGFCMYMNRAALERLGYLDPLLKRGYGEESDWAYRTAAAGWQHLGATNTVVAHQGGVSFGDEKRLRVMQNLDLIEKRFPESSLQYRQFQLLDPMRYSRNRLIRQWLYDTLNTQSTLQHSKTLYVTNTLPLAQFALKTQTMVLLLGQGNKLTLMGATPIEWRVQYHLPEDTLELEQDLATLGVQTLECVSQDLLASMRYWLPQKHILCDTSSDSLPSQHTQLWTQHELAQSSQERLIAVVGESRSFNDPAFAQLANRLSQQGSLITLIASEYSSFNGAAIWSSGHVFPCSFASSGFTERTDLICQYIEWDAVLLLDNSIKAQWQAQLLDNHSATGTRFLPWIHRNTDLRHDTAQRDHLYIEQLSDIA